MALGVMILVSQESISFLEIQDYINIKYSL